jgi:hypothetical protein
MCRKIMPILAREHVDFFRVSQEKHPRCIQEGHSMAIAQILDAELCTLAPSFPAFVYTEPETIRLRMSTLQIALPAQFYRIRCPVIVRHSAQHRSRFKTYSRRSSLILQNGTRAIIGTRPFKHMHRRSLTRIPKIKATLHFSHGKKHTENTGKKLFSVFSVCFFPWLKWAKVEPQAHPSSRFNTAACRLNRQFLS